MTRAEPSGRRLNEKDAALVKGMLSRGDRHHDIAAWFGVNQGRIAEVNQGTAFANVPTAYESDLPPKGPYSSGRAAHRAIQALENVQSALDLAKETVDSALKEIRDGNL
ncbi:hypothetical protein [Paludibacterium sp.]|uniref:hypothetical protein n=1 Tax=Paludibacterium sp. TaxID=1917523 RepID=UPI0025F13824|nr:hypothetical protein [Paludibacterium sp.]MBV8647852.1 hypothetical protein [Paludibacterium sp.]